MNECRPTTRLALVERRFRYLYCVTTIPHTTPAVYPLVAGDRFAATIRTDSCTGCSVAILGVPDELGVRLNHGRPGAALGPGAFRDALARFGTPYDAARAADIDVAVFDAGDVIPAPGSDADALAETHARITAAVGAIHDLGMVPIVVGGGHDITFPAVRAAAERFGSVGGINVDPHLDVRETVGSGMPYRRLIDAGHLDPRRFVELGVGRFSNSREHVEWARERGVTIILDNDIRGDEPFEYQVNRAWQVALPHEDSAGFVSVDLDVIDGAEAPGVSSVNPSGLRAHQVCSIARRAGADGRIRHFDIMELSPPNDDPPGAGRTARVAALVFLNFIAGFAERGGAAT